MIKIREGHISLALTEPTLEEYIACKRLEDQEDPLLSTFQYLIDEFFNVTDSENHLALALLSMNLGFLWMQENGYTDLLNRECITWLDHICGSEMSEASQH